MYDKLKMIKCVAIDEAAKIATEIKVHKMDTEMHAQALDDLQDAMKVAHICAEMEEMCAEEEEKKTSGK